MSTQFQYKRDAAFRENYAKLSPQEAQAIETIRSNHNVILKGTRNSIIWVRGLAGSGKTELANTLHRAFTKTGMFNRVHLISEAKYYNPNQVWSLEVHDEVQYKCILEFAKVINDTVAPCPRENTLIIMDVDTTTKQDVRKYTREVMMFNIRHTCRYSFLQWQAFPNTPVWNTIHNNINKGIQISDSTLLNLSNASSWSLGRPSIPYLRNKINTWEKLDDFDIIELQWINRRYFQS